MSRLAFSFGPNDVPPDRLRFTHVDGHVTEATDRATWYEKIRKHETDNGRELDADWKEHAQDQLCRILPPGWCRYEDGAVQRSYVNVRLSRDDWFRGMKVLTDIVTTDEPLVDQAEAERRAAICSSCPANVPIEGCSACVGMLNVIAQVRGAVTTEAEPLLKACSICHCSNKAQVWVKADILRKGITPEQEGQFATIPWCWKREALQIPQT